MKMTIVLLVFLGIVAAVCAVILVNGLKVGGAFSQNTNEVTVVQAARNLPKGTRLVAEDLKTALVKRHELASDKYMTNMALVVGRTVAVDVVQEDVFMADDFETAGSIQDLISKLEPGMRAVSVSLASSQVTGGLLYQGCIVDVLASFKLRGGSRSDGSKGEAVSTTLLEKVQVLAIEGQMSKDDPEDEKKSTSRTANSSRTVTVTLLLDTKQAEALQLAAANGEISVSIRSPLDEKAIDPNPTVLNRGKLTRLGMLIDPTVKLGDTETQQSGQGVLGGGSESSTWEVMVIRGDKITDQEIKVGD